MVAISDDYDNTQSELLSIFFRMNTILSRNNGYVWFSESKRTFS